jgi:hypothetical protein
LITCNARKIQRGNVAGGREDQQQHRAEWG